MHIPSEMLAGAVCPATAALATAGFAGSVYAFAKSKPTVRFIAKFALVTALVFGLQALKYPIYNGVAAHLLGGVFAVSLLGLGGGVISVALVLGVQAFAFGDGGSSYEALSANIFNMAIIGAGVGGLIRAALLKRGMSSDLSTAAAAFSAVMLATFALCAQFAFGAAEPVPASAFGALIGLHLIAAAIEVVATVALVKIFSFDAEQAPAKVGKMKLATLAAVAVASIALGEHVLDIGSQSPDAFEYSLLGERVELAE